MKKIKSIEYVGDIRKITKDTKSEDIDIPFFSKLSGFFRGHDDTSIYGNYVSFEVMPDGKEPTVLEFHYLMFNRTNSENAARGMNKVVSAIRINYVDGTSEWGLKTYAKEFVKHPKERLYPLYVEVGKIHNKYNAEITPDVIVPANVLDTLSHAKEYHEALVPYLNNCRNIKYNEIPWAKKYGKVPCKFVSNIRGPGGYIVDEYNKGRYFSSVKYFMDDWEEKNTQLGWQDASAYSKEEYAECYSYMKSIYVDEHKEKKVYGIIPVSDILSISVDKKEVWNNMDETLKNLC